MSKKSQAILPYFGVQLICIIIFFIVVISLMTMTRDVKINVQEYDEETFALLTYRRWLASPN